MSTEEWGIVVGLLAIVVAVFGIVVTLGLYGRTTKMTKELNEFLVNVIVNSAADPDTVRRMLRAGTSAAEVFKGSDGKQHIRFEEKATVTIGVKVGGSDSKH